MPYLALGICLAIGLALVGRWFVTADPRRMVRALRTTGLVLLGLILIFLAATERLGIVFGLLPFLLPFLRRVRRPAGRVRDPSPGRTSGLDTVNLRVRLDHDTGAVSGTVRTGRHAGRALESLGMADLAALAAEWRTTDPQSGTVLEAYLDRRFGAAWREPQRQDSPPERNDGRMSRAEACQVLGLKDGATTDEVRAAHRRLMKQFHPDHGGSDYIAAKLNQAKEVLLGT